MAGRRRWTVGRLTMALVVGALVLSATEPATAAGRAGSDAAEATHTVTFSGVVTCTGTGWPVQGVWVENRDGSDGFARWWAFPGRPKAARYRITVTATRPDPSVRLDIGCGRSGNDWRKTLLTPDFRTTNGAPENRRCDTSRANRARACTSAPRGQEAEDPLGIAGYCTDGAYRKWHAYAGYWPRIGGNANEMDELAEQHGFQVAKVPHVASMVVFNSAAPPYGHVGWVVDVYRDGAGTVRFDYIDMNGGTGGTAANDYHTSLFNQFDRKNGRAWDPNDQAFIVAPT